MSHPQPRLVIEHYENNATTFGPGQLKGIIGDAVKVGWSWYSRFPATAYFTLRQASSLSTDIVPGLDHIKIRYVNPHTGIDRVVFSGRFGDPDATARDVVWRAHNYLAEIALSRTGYRVMYAGKKLGFAVAQEWKRDDGKKGKKKFKDYGAKKRTYSLLNHIRTGTIQTPKRNGKPVKLDPQFGVIDVPRLLFFYDLSEIGRANTTDNVVYEVTRDNPTFNFWRNRGTYRPGLQLNHPGMVRDFNYVPGVNDIRNDLATLGTRKGQAVEIVKTRSGGKYGFQNFGRRQDTFAIKTLAGFRNLDNDSGKFSAQQTITKRAIQEATRPTRSLRLDMPWQTGFEPFEGWDLEDTFDTRLKRDDTNINKGYRIIGITGEMDEGGYRQALYLVTEDA